MSHQDNKQRHANSVNKPAVLSKDRMNQANEAYYFNGFDNYIENNNPSFIHDTIGTFISRIKLNNLNHIEYVGSISDTNSIDYYISLIRIDPTLHNQLMLI